jgi:hypothetical protein
MKAAREIGAAVAVVAALGGCRQIIGYEDPIVVGPDAGTLCSDGKKDGDETGKDCGGSCSACPDGEGCKTGADCESKVCSAGGVCLAATCNDKIANGEESDVDCGGATCGGCGPEQKCKVDGDCKVKMCAAGKCVSTCTDGLKGGGESDVDCGGGATSGCPACAVAKSCKQNVDCASGICNAQVCADSYVWDRAFVAGTTSDTVDIAAVAIGPDGNAVAAGTFTGSTSFGSAAVTSTGGADVFIATFDKAGNPLVSHRYGDGAGADQRVTDVAWSTSALTSDKPIALVGSFAGSLNFTSTPIVSTGSYDAYVALFGAAGSPLWATSFGHAGSSQSADAVAFTADAAIIVAGTFSGEMNIGSVKLNSAGSRDLFVARFTVDGALDWAKRFGGSGSEMRVSMRLDPAGNIILVGTTDGPLDFGNGLLPASHDTDVFVAKLDASGNAIWSKRFGAPDTGEVSDALVVDPTGDIILSGDISNGSIDFGGGALVGDGNATIFLAKLGAASGAHLWSRAANALGSRLAVDGASNVVLSTGGGAATDLGGGPLTGPGHVLLAKYSSTGPYVWGHRFGDSQSQYAGPVAAYDAHGILAAGRFNAAIQFGAVPLVSSNGGWSSYLAKLLTP